MEVVICKTKEEASKLAADMITAAVKKNPKTVLGLATGSTPVLMYSEMAKAVKAKKVSYKQVKSWNLDEYVGLPGTHDQSYRYFMNKNLFEKIDIKLSNTHVLNGMAKDPEQECRDYEAQIRKAGGIDIQVLGIGSDGHIAFNEPGTSLASRTGLRKLTRDTRIVNSRFFDNDPEKVPAYALCTGVATVMDAKEVLIEISGHNKARAMAHVVEGGISQMWTCSCLQMHENAIIACDEAACGELKVDTYKYFLDIEKEERL